MDKNKTKKCTLDPRLYAKRVYGGELKRGREAYKTSPFFPFSFSLSALFVLEKESLGLRLALLQGGWILIYCR